MPNSSFNGRSLSVIKKSRPIVTKFVGSCANEIEWGYDVMSPSVRVPRQDATDLSATTGNNDAKAALHQSSRSFFGRTNYELQHCRFRILSECR